MTESKEKIFDPTKDYYEIEVTAHHVVKEGSRNHLSIIFTQKVNDINLQRVIGAINAPPEWAIAPPPIIESENLDSKDLDMPPGEVKPI